MAVLFLLIKLTSMIVLISIAFSYRMISKHSRRKYNRWITNFSSLPKIKEGLIRKYREMTQKIPSDIYKFQKKVRKMEDAAECPSTQSKIPKSSMSKRDTSIPTTSK